MTAPRCGRSLEHRERPAWHFEVVDSKPGGYVREGLTKTRRENDSVGRGRHVDIGTHARRSAISRTLARVASLDFDQCSDIGVPQVDGVLGAARYHVGRVRIIHDPATVRRWFPRPIPQRCFSTDRIASAAAPASRYAGASASAPAWFAVPS